MLKEKLKLIPHLPGSYQMKNSDGTIIYVGKAKDLFKRVNSYFNRPQTGKTAKMVSEIADFSYIVASSELEAFLLEFNLIVRKKIRKCFLDHILMLMQRERLLL